MSRESCSVGAPIRHQISDVAHCTVTGACSISRIGLTRSVGTTLLPLHRRCNRRRRFEGVLKTAAFAGSASNASHAGTCCLRSNGVKSPLTVARNGLPLQTLPGQVRTNL